MAVALGSLLLLGGIAQSADHGEVETFPDFQISFMGGRDDIWGQDEAEQPAVACSSTDATCLVVWRGEEDILPLVDDETEIFGTVLTLGAPAPPHIRFSAQGPIGDKSFYVWDPAVAHNSTDNEYLVVWSGADNNEKYEFDIYGARYVSAASSVTASLEISDSPDQGSSGWEDADAEDPDVVHNPTANEYLVVYGLYVYDAGTGTHQKEIFGQRLSGAGALQGSQFRISTMGPEPPAPNFDEYWGNSPAVAYNPTGDVYLVVWVGETDVGALAMDEREIWGQLVDGTTGAPKGGHIRISTLGTDGDESQRPNYPDVAASPDSGEFLVVWSHYQTGSPNEIWGQRVSSTTGPLLGSNYQISQPPVVEAMEPAITYNTNDLEYLVIWTGSSGAVATLLPEIWGQRLDSTGNEIGISGFRVSHMGPDTGPSAGDYIPSEPEVAFSPINGQYLPVWTGWHRPQPQYSVTAYEIFGQLLPRAFRSFIADQ
jgi:hypothetical protein